MGNRIVALFFAAFALLYPGFFAGLAFAATPAISSPPPVAYLDVAPEEKVGSVSAGLMCLPKGQLRVADFVDGRTGFTQSVFEAWKLRSNLVTVQIAEVHLTAVNVKLCARSWGLFGRGDTKSLSGRVEFRFRRLLANAGAAQTSDDTVAFTLEKRDALPASEILVKALRILFDRSLASADSSSR